MSLFTSKKPCFSYDGITSDNKKINHIIYAKNKSDALSNLHQKKIQVIKIKRLYFTQLLKPKIKNKDLWLMSTQLVNTLKAAIPLDQTLSIIQNQCPKNLKELLIHCKHEIKHGKSLSTTLLDFQANIPASYICFIEAGEMHGDLTDSLTKANAFLWQKIQLFCLFKKALTYPTIIILVSVAILFGMIHFIIPQFQQMYAQMGSQLPWVTQLVINSFKTIEHYTPIFTMFIGILTSLSIFLIHKKPRLKYFLQKIMLKLPLLGRYLTMKEIIPWLSLLGSCLQSGIPMKKSLIAAHNALSLYYYKKPMPQIIQQVEGGHLLSDSLRLHRWVDKDDLTFICIGELNGELGKAMMQQARLLQNQMTEQVESLSRLLEPLILVILALVMGSLLIALYLPLFQMGQLF